jgi:vacuolar-type H+-ATPase subunit I/STV1
MIVQCRGSRRFAKTIAGMWEGIALVQSARIHLNKKDKWGQGLYRGASIFMFSIFFNSAQWFSIHYFCTGGGGGEVSHLLHLIINNISFSHTKMSACILSVDY